MLLFGLILEYMEWCGMTALGKMAFGETAHGGMALGKKALGNMGGINMENLINPVIALISGKNKPKHK